MTLGSRGKRAEHKEPAKEPLAPKGGIVGSWHILEANSIQLSPWETRHLCTRALEGMGWVGTLLCQPES